MTAEDNPFVVSGRPPPDEMIDRDEEATQLLAYARTGQWSRLQAPRRYGKTTLLDRVLAAAAAEGMPTARVDLEGVLTLGGVVVRIERGYAATLRGRLARTAESILQSWSLGLSLGAVGFSVALQSNPRLNAESVLLRLLELPVRLAERTGKRCVVAFDEMQDLLRVDGADGILRSVIQHQTDSACYLFAGSEPTLMRRLFEDPSRPLLEQALPMELPPLPYEATAEYVELRFRRTRRDPGAALGLLLDFTRGHPQRTMLLAHHLWAASPRGSAADESVWFEALARVLRAAEQLLRARWESLPLNEQRIALALPRPGTIHEEATLAAVGLKRGSVDKALATLEGRGEVIRTPFGPRLTDPLLEHWLRERGPL